MDNNDYEMLKKTLILLGIPYRVFDQPGTQFTPQGYTKALTADRIMAVGTVNFLFLMSGKYVGMMTVEKIFDRRDSVTNQVVKTEERM